MTCANDGTVDDICKGKHGRWLDGTLFEDRGLMHLGTVSSMAIQYGVIPCITQPNKKFFYLPKIFQRV